MNNSAVGGSWNDFEKEIFTADEIAEMDKKLAADLKRIKAWTKKKPRRKQLNKIHHKNTEIKKIY